MRVAVDFPNDFVEMLTEQAIAREMRLAYALSLFKDARITIAKAAELAGITIYEFMAACKANRIPVIEVSREELVQELQSIGRNR